MNVIEFFREAKENHLLGNPTNTSPNWPQIAKEYHLYDDYYIYNREIYSYNRYSLQISYTKNSIMDHINHFEKRIDEMDKTNQLLHKYL